jgi:hypothetical protein
MIFGSATAAESGSLQPIRSAGEKLVRKEIPLNLLDSDRPSHGRRLHSLTAKG